MAMSPEQKAALDEAVKASAKARDAHSAVTKERGGAPRKAGPLSKSETAARRADDDAKRAFNRAKVAGVPSKDVSKAIKSSGAQAVSSVEKRPSSKLHTPPKPRTAQQSQDARKAATKIIAANRAADAAGKPRPNVTFKKGIGTVDAPKAAAPKDRTSSMSLKQLQGMSGAERAKMARQDAYDSRTASIKAKQAAGGKLHKAEKQHLKDAKTTDSGERHAGGKRRGATGTGLGGSVARAKGARGSPAASRPAYGHTGGTAETRAAMNKATGNFAAADKRMAANRGDAATATRHEKSIDALEKAEKSHKAAGGKVNPSAGKHVPSAPKRGHGPAAKALASAEAKMNRKTGPMSQGDMDKLNKLGAAAKKEAAGGGGRRPKVMRQTMTGKKGGRYIVTSSGKKHYIGRGRR